MERPCRPPLFLFGMKKVLSFLIVIVAVVCQVWAQAYEYKLNARTGKFDMVNSAYGILNVPFNGNRAVTRAGLPAINTGDSTLVAWINNYFFPSTNPISTISVSGGTSREFMTAGAALTVDLSWTVNRPVACLPISTITVDAVPQTVMTPFNEGQTQTGTLTGRTLNRNINTTYTVTAVATDAKTGSASSTVTWYWGRYWGAFSSPYPPTDPRFSISDAQIIALTGAGVGTGFELSTTRVKTYNGINGAGNYLVFAFPTAWGTPTFVANGLITTAFTQVRNNLFTNASGGQTNYQVWVSNTTQAGAIAQFQIQ